ncbi:MAG: hypothetical protein JW804_02240 [Sedimentisphaerales bacterium]|nr:hypothetical protein [Sedimentisphaerales bacterium]
MGFKPVAIYNIKMNNLTIFTNAINFKPVERIMTYDFIINRTVLEKHAGYDINKKYTFEELAHINAKAFKAIGLDVTRCIYDPAKNWMDEKIENWIRFFNAEADKWEVSQKSGTAWLSKRPFKNLKELEKNLPNPPRYDQVSQWYKTYFKTIKEIFDSYDLVFIGSVEGPLNNSFTYTGMELFMLGIHDAPELIAHLMDCSAKLSTYIAQVFAENTSAPLLFMGEDCAGTSGPMFSPDFIRKEAMPRWEQIRKPIKEKGFKLMFHTDGRYGLLLPIILEEFGAEALNPIERNGCNDIFEIHRQYPQKLLFGNVCCAATLPHGNIYDVEDETLELIERIGPDGGIFIGSSGEVNDLLPVENVEAMYRTVKKYGIYPINLERIQKRKTEIKNKLNLRKA